MGDSQKNFNQRQVIEKGMLEQSGGALHLHVVVCNTKFALVTPNYRNTKELTNRTKTRLMHLEY